MLHFCTVRAYENNDRISYYKSFAKKRKVIFFKKKRVYKLCTLIHSFRLFKYI